MEDMEVVAKKQTLAEADPKPKKGISKLLMMIGIVILILGVGLGAYLMGRKAKDKEAAANRNINDEIIADIKSAAKDAKTDGKDAGKEGEKGGKEGEKGGKEGEKGGKEGDKADAASAQKKELTYTFEPFAVNLNEAEPRWYISVTISIEAASAEAKKKIEDNIPSLREATNFLLSSKTKEEARSPEGKERIKRELFARYEGLLGPNTINELFLNDPKVGWQ